jgi:hypothetical protein
LLDGQGTRSGDEGVWNRSDGYRGISDVNILGVSVCPIFVTKQVTSS